MVSIEAVLDNFLNRKKASSTTLESKNDRLIGHGHKIYAEWLYGEVFVYAKWREKTSIGARQIERLLAKLDGVCVVNKTDTPELRRI